MLGSGAFGEVYRVKHKFLGYQALKLLKSETLEEEQKKSFITEATILSNFTHPNVVRVYDANYFRSKKKKIYFISMEYVAGEPLIRLLERENKLSIDLSISIIKDICSGISIAHNYEPPVIHRDIKPQNILLSYDAEKPVAKVSDFGVAKVVDQKMRITDSAGTLTFMAPEGFLGVQNTKSDVFLKLDKILPNDCIVASNTSSISITVLSASLSDHRQANFLGLHFFSPVHRMKLVEVISAMDTSQRATELATEACIEAGKVPIQVKDVVGFAVNRMLFALWNEALRLVEEGACTPEDIDTGCKLGLGHPVGPFELMDLTSNTLNLQVGEILKDAYRDRFLPRPILKQIVAAGRAGRKTGRGWYRYDEKGRQKKK